MWIQYVAVWITIVVKQVNSQPPAVCQNVGGAVHNDFPPAQNHIINRRFSSTGDNGVTYLAVGKGTVTCAGRVQSWHVNFITSRCDVIWLQVWRPTGGANQYTLVGQTQHDGTTERPCTGGGGAGDVTIDTAEQIPVRPGDVIGWRQEGSNGMLMYDENPLPGANTYGAVLWNTGCSPTAAGATCTFTDQRVRDYTLQAHVIPDDLPRFNNLPSPATFTIREDARQGELVYQAQASAKTTLTPTLGHVVYYSLASFNPAACSSMVEIDQFTGQIRLKTAVDRANLNTANGRCTFNVEAAIDNRANPTTSPQVTLDITLLNAAHVFNPAVISNILRDTVGSQNALITNLVLADPDYNAPTGPQSSKSFFVSGAEPDASIFTINQPPATPPAQHNTGNIACNTDLTLMADTEPRTYELNITARDADNSAGPLVVRVEITNLRKRPVLTVPPASTVILETETGIPTKNLATLACQCDNTGTSAYTLSMVHQYPKEEADKFQLTGNTIGSQIQVIPNSAFDYDVTRKYHLEIEILYQILDYTDVQNMTVEVTRVNKAPSFVGPNPLTATMEEEQEIDTPVAGIIFNATDRDTKYGDVLSLTLLGGAWADSFYVLPGSDKLYVRSRIDIDPNTPQVVTTLQVRVTDQEGLTDDINVTITIQDINDNAPVFPNSQFQASIQENSDFTLTLGTFPATDADAGMNADIEYSIENSPTGPKGDHYFHVDGNTGLLRVKHPIDYQEHTSVSFKLKATDKGTPRLSGTMDIFITVEDTNDNRPVFTKMLFNTEIPSHVPIHTTISSILATDADSVGNVTYFLLRPEERFYLGATTGQIMTVKSLEADQKYILYCYARDHGTNPGELFSDPTIARIDAFEGGRHLVDITLDIPLETYKTKDTEFISKISNVFSPWVAKELKRTAASGQTVVTLYILENTATDDLANLAMTKPFVHRDLILQRLRADPHGNPSEILKGDEFASFRPIRVEPTYPTWFPETPAGVATVATLCVLAAIAIAVIILLMWRFRVGPFKYKQPPPRPSSRSRVSPEYEEEFKLNYGTGKPEKKHTLPVIIPPKTDTLPTRQASIRQRPPPPSLQGDMKVSAIA